ncbi:hypothetical protein TUMEXPCC7403_17150 [Tumidithrix helvetica PCC 7403]|uniref:Uma2 family endonuclease n=1 Tax=Tumidithrix helvetica TaxID=3457545 RepID=UPI003C9203F8
MVAEIQVKTLADIPQTYATEVVAEHRVLLHNVSWETFECLLAESGDSRSTRFYYLDGTLEIMYPLSLHEGSNRFIEKLLTIIADELDIDMRNLGSLLMKIKQQKLGGEPDSCYYIQNEPAIRGKEDIVVGEDPPPDLVLEVDITSPSDRRLPILRVLVYLSCGAMTATNFYFIPCKMVSMSVWSKAYRFLGYLRRSWWNTCKSVC